MKVVSYKEPRSSFLSVEKDLGVITEAILKNKNLKKLLHYTTSKALSMPPLNDEESVSLMKKNIKIIPKLYIDGSVLNYMIISFDNFTLNGENPEFRDNIITFDIICHLDQWELQDFQLRPYRIAAELDTMFNGAHLSGIGRTEFLGMSQIILNEEFAGLSLMYSAVHSEDDKKNMANPMNQEKFVDDFNELYNNKKDPWILD